jgi:hypothetical protein
VDWRVHERKTDNNNQRQNNHKTKKRKPHTTAKYQSCNLPNYEVLNSFSELLLRLIQIHIPQQEIVREGAMLESPVCGDRLVLERPRELLEQRFVEHFVDWNIMAFAPRNGNPRIAIINLGSSKRDCLLILLKRSTNESEQSNQPKYIFVNVFDKKKTTKC